MYFWSVPVLLVMKVCSLSTAALADVSELESVLHSSMVKTDNYQRLLELQKDLIGVDNLATPTREFIRLGCLSKLSGKGLQQRMFFLVKGTSYNFYEVLPLLCILQ